MIALRPIDESNFDAIVAMKRPEGEGFVAPNSYSLAQCWLYRENGDVFPWAIYEGDTPVGFLLLEEDLEERSLILWRVMFPEEKCGRGYGTQTVQLVLEQARQVGKYDRVLLDCDQKNLRARHVYEKLGFRPTGRAGHGSDELEFSLNAEETLPECRLATWSCGK